jgi:molybdenum cofactor cytidylyltransferase
MKEVRIGGLVLAAGMGSRVGTPKLRLKKEGVSFLRHCVRALLGGGADTVVCIVSPENADWASDEVQEAHVVVNSASSEEMLSSVRLGVRALMECQGILILPVDHPLVTEQTVAALMNAGRREIDAVIKPTHSGNPGHPIFIPMSLYPFILASGSQDTLRNIISSSGITVRCLEVTDAGILRNINTLEDFSSLSRKEPLR